MKETFNLILNLIWLLLGGIWMALGWWLAGIVMCISIIGIPWARSAFVMGRFVLWPSGYQAVPRNQITGKEDIGTGVLGCLGNIIWLIFGGIALALGHLLTAALLAITIIGIPFAYQHLKMVRIALMPIGMMIVPIPDIPPTENSPE